MSSFGAKDELFLVLSVLSLLFLILSENPVDDRLNRLHDAIQVHHPAHTVGHLKSAYPYLNAIPPPTLVSMVSSSLFSFSSVYCRFML